MALKWPRILDVVEYSMNKYGSKLGFPPSLCSSSKRQREAMNRSRSRGKHLLKHPVPNLSDEELKRRFRVDDVCRIPSKIRRMNQKELQATFSAVYTDRTASNNNEWMRRKLLAAVRSKTINARKASRKRRERVYSALSEDGDDQDPDVLDNDYGPLDSSRPAKRGRQPLSHDEYDDSDGGMDEHSLKEDDQLCGTAVEADDAVCSLLSLRNSVSIDALKQDDGLVNGVGSARQSSDSSVPIARATGKRSAMSRRRCSKVPVVGEKPRPLTADVESSRLPGTFDQALPHPAWVSGVSAAPTTTVPPELMMIPPFDNRLGPANGQRLSHTSTASNATAATVDHLAGGELAEETAARPALNSNASNNTSSKGVHGLKRPSSPGATSHSGTSASAAVRRAAAHFDGQGYGMMVPGGYATMPFHGGTAGAIPYAMSPGLPMLLMMQPPQAAAGAMAPRGAAAAPRVAATPAGPMLTQLPMTCGSLGALPHHFQPVLDSAAAAAAAAAVHNGGAMEDGVGLQLPHNVPMIRVHPQANGDAAEHAAIARWQSSCASGSPSSSKSSQFGAIHPFAGRPVGGLSRMMTSSGPVPASAKVASHAGDCK